MATRTFSGTLDTLEHEGSEITYKGSTDACDRSENIRGFQFLPSEGDDEDDEEVEKKTYKHCNITNKTGKV